LASGLKSGLEAALGNFRFDMVDSSTGGVAMKEPIFKSVR
jgi:hypothetical protein